MEQNTVKNARRMDHLVTSFWIDTFYAFPVTKPLTLKNGVPTRDAGVPAELDP